MNRGEGCCFWCGQLIHDDPDPAPCWVTEDGDSGCGLHPISGLDGVGPHETEEDVYRIVREYHLGKEVV